MAIDFLQNFLVLFIDKRADGSLGIKAPQHGENACCSFYQSTYLVEQQLIWARRVPQLIRSPPEYVYDLRKEQSLRNLSLPEIIMVPKRNWVLVVTVFSLLITPNSFSTMVSDGN